MSDSLKNMNFESGVDAVKHIENPKEILETNAERDFSQTKLTSNNFLVS